MPPLLILLTHGPITRYRWLSGGSTAAVLQASAPPAFTVLHGDTATYFPLNMWTAVLDMKQGKFSQIHVSRALWCTAIYMYIYHVVVDISCLWDLGVDL